MTKKLLICAQAIDQSDPQLSFFLLWVREMAKHFDSLTVICLRKGDYELPSNVHVFSLGGNGKLSRAYKLLRGAYRFRNNYDAVFVHQGQEFVLVAGWLWALLGKPVYMWRNHYAGSGMTGIAAAFCKKIFYTSKHSYTARYKKALMMPVGVASFFAPVAGVERKARSVLFLARMARSKRPEMLLRALELLAQEGADFSAAFVGSPLPKDGAYYESLKKSAQQLGSRVAFMPGVTNAQTPALYSSAQIFVNCSSSGMYDKTIFEAAACGCAVLAASDDWRSLAGDAFYFKDEVDLKEKLKALLLAPRADLRPLIQAHSLERLMQELRAHIV